MLKRQPAPVDVQHLARHIGCCIRGEIDGSTYYFRRVAKASERHLPN